MGQIKNIKLHIVTDIKRTGHIELTCSCNKYYHFNSSTITMANTIEKPTATEPVQEKKVEKEPMTETEPNTEPKATTPDATEADEISNGHTEEQNANVQVESSKVDDAEEKEDTTLKRKDAPADTDESPKKQELVDSEEKEAEPAVPTVEV